MLDSSEFLTHPLNPPPQAGDFVCPGGAKPSMTDYMLKVIREKYGK